MICSICKNKRFFYGKKFNSVMCGICGNVFVPKELKEEDKFAENLIRSLE